MSHAIAIERLLETLFVLEHIAHGSRAYCNERQIFSLEDTGYSDMRSTWGLTKSAVSTNLTEVAIRARIILDYCYTINKNETKRIEEQACIGLVISYDTKGTERLTLRDTLDKVVHATLVRVEFSSSLDMPDDPTTFWDGQVFLAGTKRIGNDEVEWSHRLVLPAWCKAMVRLLTYLESHEATVFIGQDFRP